MKPLGSIVSVGDRIISEEIKKKKKGGRFGTVSSGSGRDKWLAFEAERLAPIKCKLLLGKVNEYH